MMSGDEPRTEDGPRIDSVGAVVAGGFGAVTRSVEQAAIGTQATRRRNAVHMVLTP